MSEQAESAAQLSGGPPRRAWIYLSVSAIGLSLFAAAIVLGNVAAGAPRQADENSWAHLFQLAMAAQIPLILLFLAMADWRQKRRVVILLGLQIVAAAAAFGALAWSGY